MIREFLIAILASAAVCALFYAALKSGMTAVTVAPDHPDSQFPHRPMTRETYVRLELSSAAGTWTVIPGLELRGSDNLDELRERLREVVTAWLNVGWRNEQEAAFGIAGALTQQFPGRAWFLEVEGAAGEWVQVYQPWVPNQVQLPRKANAGGFA